MKYSLKIKTHRFTLAVKTYKTRPAAELAILAAFGKRQPDYCEFNLLRKSPKRTR